MLNIYDVVVRDLEIDEDVVWIWLLVVDGVFEDDWDFEVLYYGFVMIKDEMILCIVGWVFDYVVIVMIELFVFVMIIFVGDVLSWVMFMEDDWFCFIVNMCFDDVFVIDLERKVEIICILVGCGVKYIIVGCVFK